MNLYEWLQTAIGNEKGAAGVYGRIAQKSDPDIASIARVFQEEELSHAERISVIVNGIKESDLVLSTDMPNEALIKTKNESLSDDELNFMNRKELFLFALKGEKESIELYGELEKLFGKGSKEGELFGKLAAEEKNHMFFVLQQLHEL